MGRGRDTGAGLGAYLKAAFFFRWNLLLFAGAAAAAMLSPSPDIALPLVAAAELTWLAGLTAIPRFRAAIDAKVHAERRPAELGPSPRVSYGRLVQGLRPEARARFQKLRARCLEMRHIARGVSGKAGGGRADEIRTPALNRMLWVFVRLLSSQQALERFLQTTDAGEIRRSLDALRLKQEAAAEGEDERLLRAIVDSIETAEMRLANYERSERNAEFVEVELDRIEGKIQALTEMAVNNQDPDYISSQVDSVAESMVHTEDAIRQMQHITGLSEELGEAPEILEAEGLEVAR